MLEKQENRKKIKQLKYKIAKEQAKLKQLGTKNRNLKDINQQELGTDRIFKKANFKLSQKGMDISDWLNCLPYDDEFQMDSLLRVGKQLGLEFDREQTNLMLNFFSDDLSVLSSIAEFKGQCYKSGIRLK